jgi:hypothetical protein
MKDYSIKASKLKTLIRSWHAKGINSGDAMKLMTLYLGVEEFLDPQTNIYPKKMFNKIRKANGYRSIPTLMEMVQKSESFQLITNKLGEIIAFCSPLICDIESVADGDYFVANGDSNYLNNFDVPIKGTSTTTYKNKREGHGKMPFPELDEKLFLQQPQPAAVKRVKEYFYYLAYDPERTNRLLQPLINEIYHLCKEDQFLMAEVINAYLEDRVEPVFRRRKGIENWSESQIDGWLQSLHQPRLAHIKAYEAMRNWKELHEKK